MKTKIILAILVLLTIAHSCSERSEEDGNFQEKKEIINHSRELRNTTSNKSVSDSIKNGILLNGTKTESDDAETVDPGHLGTPPTRP